MAKVLQNIFTPGVDEVAQTYTIESWHVSQSVDALTGASDYDITISGSLTIIGPVSSSGGFTGSLLGTSSWANNVISASNALTASYALNASSSISASLAQTASYVLNAVSASNALTASYVNPLNQKVTITGSLSVGSPTVIASAPYSFAQGDGTSATATSSVATGQLTQATGNNSFAAGLSTTATGNNSFAAGYYTNAIAQNQFSVGRLNFSPSPPIEDYGLFMVGNGTVTNSNAFRVSGSGQCLAGSTFTNGGADYAEYFESIDGTSIPYGTVVELENGKIKVCTNAENAIGVISVKPSVLGNSDEGTSDEWVGKYEKDVWGNYIMEEQTREDIINGQVQITTFIGRKLSSTFNPEIKYIPREARPEWNVVGLLGQIRVLKNQQIPSRWIKMKDINNEIAIYLVR